MDKTNDDPTSSPELKKRLINTNPTNEPSTPPAKKELEKDKKDSHLEIALYMLMAFAIGFSFGFILEKSKVYDPINIRQQMIFKKFVMMKMFFTALATSALSILLMNLFFKQRYVKVFESYRDLLKTKSFLSIISGGLILGLGMQIGGACPGMMFIQIGAGVGYSWCTLLGGITAAFLHGLLSNYLSKGPDSEEAVSKTFFELLKVNAYVVRVGFILMLYAAVALMEYFIPWTSDYTLRNVNTPFFNVTSEVWPPEIAGFFLGSLQFFSLLLMSKSLGTSSSFTTIAGICFSKSSLEKYPYVKKFTEGKSNWSVMVFVASSVLGSFVSSILGGAFGHAKIVHPFNAFLGGFLLVLGARIASGCNTGHGISGTSHLFLGSFVAMIFMFVGGIGLAVFAYTNDFFLE